MIHRHASVQERAATRAKTCGSAASVARSQRCRARRTARPYSGIARDNTSKGDQLQMTRKAGGYTMTNRHGDCSDPAGDQEQEALQP